MKNLYELNLQTQYRKLACDGLLFVEFQCVPGDVKVDIWSQHSYLAFIQSGKKTWITPENEFTVTAGDAIFCKKGAHVLHNYFEEQFCALLFFIPDDFIKQVIIDSEINPSATATSGSLLKLSIDLGLKLYFESMLSFFTNEHNPSSQLLKLKFRELVLQVITGSINPNLSSYFFSLAKEKKSSLEQVMMENYRYHLNQEDFAKLAARSLSGFKREFQQVFGTSCNRWLIEMRLKYAKRLLLTTEQSISEVAYSSGFDTASHFIRCFKNQYALPPQQFRQQQTVLV